MKSDITAADTNSGIMNGFSGIIINVLLCFAFTVFLLLIFALIITYTDFPDKFISPVVVMITVISIILAALMSAVRRNSKGWLIGALTGIIYMVILYCLGVILYDNVAFGTNTFAMFMLGLLSGTFGGILGINLKSR